MTATLIACQKNSASLKLVLALKAIEIGLENDLTICLCTI